MDYFVISGRCIDRVEPRPRDTCGLPLLLHRLHSFLQTHDLSLVIEEAGVLDGRLFRADPPLLIVIGEHSL